MLQATRMYPVPASVASFQSSKPSSDRLVSAPLSVSEQSVLKQKKPFLLSIDIDNTLLPWERGAGQQQHWDDLALQRYQHLLAQPALRNATFVLLNTGRSLSAAQELGDKISKIPFDALGANDGQELYIRPDTPLTANSSQTNAQWLKTENASQRDPRWQSTLGQWSIVDVIRDVENQLLNTGFIKYPPALSGPDIAMHGYLKTDPLNPGNAWKVKIRPDQTWFEISHLNPATGVDPTLLDFSRQLAKSLETGLQERWPQLHTELNPTGQAAYLHLSPHGHDKSKLVQHLIRERLSAAPLGIVSAGDSGNDVAILKKREIAGVPNYPVFVGDNPTALKELASEPPANLVTVPWNALDTGIRTQLAKMIPQIVDQPVSIAQPTAFQRWA